MRKSHLWAVSQSTENILWQPGLEELLVHQNSLVHPWFDFSTLWFVECVFFYPLKLICYVKCTKMTSNDLGWPHMTWSGHKLPSRPPTMAQCSLIFPSFQFKNSFISLTISLSRFKFSSIWTIWRIAARILSINCFRISLSAEHVFYFSLQIVRIHAASTTRYFKLSK